MLGEHPRQLLMNKEDEIEKERRLSQLYSCPCYDCTAECTDSHRCKPFNDWYEVKPPLRDLEPYGR